MGTQLATSDLAPARAGLVDALAAPVEAVPLLWSLVVAGASVLVYVIGAVVAVKLAVALATGTLGAVDRNKAAALGAAPVRLPALLFNLLAAFAVGVCMTQVGSLIAGSSRAVDATQTGLAALWISWGAWAMAGTAVLMAILGLVELLVMRRARRTSLFQTAEQARDELRASGGPRS